MGPALQMEGLAKDYGDGRGLEPTNLVVEAGELVMLVGANGAGKSTLLACCTGLLEPTAGTVMVSGAQAGSTAARRALSYITDTPVLYDDLDVLEHLEYIAGLHDTDAWRERADQLLNRLRLQDRADDLPSRFSRGLRQKTALAVGLIRPFDLLLVDEPFVGLDAPAQEELCRLLMEEAERGAAVVVATHQLSLAGVASRCLGMRDGSVVYDGPPDRDTIWSLVSG